MITFQEIDHTTGHYELEVAEDQKDFVATIPVLLARAFIYRKCRSRAYIIFADETPVGMDLYYDREEEFVVRGNDAARHLYEKFGFKETCSSDAAIGMELVL